MGLAGIALAMLGCNVVLTDIASVYPLLKANVEANLGAAARSGAPSGQAHAVYALTQCHPNLPAGQRKSCSSPLQQTAFSTNPS